MSLIDRILIAAVWTASAVRGANTTGTPLVLGSLAETGTGEAISDDYTLVLSAVSGGTATVTVGTLSPNNPYKGRVVSGVALDGVTIYRNIIPGIAIVFSGTGANGNVGTVYVGSYSGTYDAFGVDAGTPQDETRHQAYNTGPGSVSSAVATLLSKAIHVRKVGAVFGLVRPFAPGATYKPLGGGSDQINPYQAAISAVAGAGAGKTATLQFDGALLGAASILDLTTGLTQNSSGLKAITPAYIYRVVTGNLTGLEFALDPTCANGDTANILIFPHRYVQITNDVAGAANGAGWGTADVVLTQSGQAAGVIQPLGDAYFWTRVVIPPGSDSSSNPWVSFVALSGTESSAANWTG